MNKKKNLIMLLVVAAVLSFVRQLLSEPVLKRVSDYNWRSFELTRSGESIYFRELLMEFILKKFPKFVSDKN